MKTLTAALALTVALSGLTACGSSSDQTQVGSPAAPDTTLTQPAPQQVPTPLREKAGGHGHPR